MRPVLAGPRVSACAPCGGCATATSPPSPPPAPFRSSPAARRASSRCSPSRSCAIRRVRSEEHTSELQSPCNLVCRLLLEKKKVTLHRLNADVVSPPLVSKHALAGVDVTVDVNGDCQGVLDVGQSAEVMPLRAISDN